MAAYHRVEEPANLRPLSTGNFDGVPMMRRVSSPWQWRIGAALLSAVLLVVPVQATGTDGIALFKDAKAGRFDRVLNSLRVGSYNGHHQVRDLIHDLEQYQQHRNQHVADQRTGQKEALEKMAESEQKDDLYHALTYAIEAHSLAGDPATLLTNENILALVDRSVEAAQGTARSGDWVQALSLYRALDLLFEDQQIYKDDAKRAGRHVRILQLYSPKFFQQLYAEHTTRLANDQDKPHELPQLDDETWEQRVEGVTIDMLHTILDRAARKHVSNPGFRPLLLGAIQSLLILANTDGLDETFPSLGNTHRIKSFCHKLERIRGELNRFKHDMSRRNAFACVKWIVSANDKTVELPEAVLVFEMADGVTTTLDDFSAVIWPHDLEIFSRHTQGTFTGVGIQIERRDGRLLVVSPLLDTPAFRAGIRPGDIVATVDGRHANTWSLDRAVREITGPEGSQVVLGVERAGSSGLIDIPINRAKIIIESIRGWQRDHHDPRQVHWDYFVDPQLKIGYIRLSQFLPQTADDLEGAINQMQDQGGLNALILDLRFNPGGLLTGAIDVTNRFISSGNIVATVDADGNASSTRKATRHRTHATMPLVILVNRTSASASEIVAGALQDHKRATIVGTRTFGKGSVQDLFWHPGHLKPDFSLKLTTQYYMLPKGRIIHRKPDSVQWGVEPDIEVSVTDEIVAEGLKLRQKIDVVHFNDKPIDPDESKLQATDILAQGLDPQLEAALLVLKIQLVVDQITLARSD